MSPPNLLDRPDPLGHLLDALRRSRVVALLGPRQCGKTTLARQIVPVDSPNYFDLEDPASLARLDEPMTALSGLVGVVAIDEIQRRPNLFPVLRVLADRESDPARFLILGSAAPDFLRQPAESLAGRLETVVLRGFSLNEVGVTQQPVHWLRGGFPRSYLAGTDVDSAAWRRSFIAALLERDLPMLGLNTTPQLLRRFWVMLAHLHGQTWNGAELARALAVSQPTVRRYLDILEGVFMVRVLAPWHSNVMKRQVRSPKVYVRDSGLLHSLLGVLDQKGLLESPRIGASWEGYVIEELLARIEPDEAYFWGTHAGAELDLLVLKNGRRLGVECKRSDAPRMTPSMRAALTDLDLDRLYVVYPGMRRYDLADNVTVVPLAQVVQADQWVNI